MAHECHARDCKRNVPPRMLMCGKHWKMVPRHLQDAVWATYMPGQEITKTPSREYLIAAKDAINAVAEREGKQPLPTLRDVSAPPRCPVHNIPDCSPLLNACSWQPNALRDFG
jgi:hypothetical protein